MSGPTLWIELWIGPYLLDCVIDLAGQMLAIRRIARLLGDSDARPGVALDLVLDRHRQHSLVGVAEPTGAATSRHSAPGSSASQERPPDANAKNAGQATPAILKFLFG
jgi:hypothetical protein